jgi:hypothetical protein
VQPARAVEGLLDLPEDDDLHNAWVSRQNPHPGELSSCFILWGLLYATSLWRYYGLEPSVILFRNKALKSYHTVV